MNTAVLPTEQTQIIASQYTLAAVLEKFIEDQDVKPSSKALYKRTLSQYFNWIEQSGYKMAEIERTHILLYRDKLMEEGKSSLTATSYITSVRLFYEWTEAHKIYPNVAKGVKSPKRKQQFRKQPLTPAQTAAMLATEQESHSKRDYAIINLLVRTGLRTIEVSRANVEDITFKGGKRVLMVKGKGRDEKDNFVILTDKAYQPIKAYLDERKAVGGQPLFISTSNNNKGERMTTRTISYIAKEALKSIGLDDKVYTAHSLRHTAAVNILRAGGSLEMAQLTMRHTNPATTQIYTATIDEDQRLEANGESLLDRMY